MNIDQLIAGVKKYIADELAKREAQTKVIDAIRGQVLAESRATTTPDEADKVRAARAAIDAIDADVTERRARLTELEAEKASDEAARSLASTMGTPEQRSGVQVGAEPRTYTRETAQEGVSFFADAYNNQRGSAQAAARIERHAREVQVHGEMTKRALTSGGVAGLVIPQYLVDLAAPVLRAGRPVANAANRHQLPASGMSLVIPRGTTGASAAAQATENAAVSNTDEVWANLTVNVNTVSGQQQISRQAIERGEVIDEMVYGDLARAHAAQVDNYVINGTGASNQPFGLLNTVGIGAATAFGAAPGPANFNLKVAGANTNVTLAGSGIYPKVLVMHPRRWGWMQGLVDSANRPIVETFQMGMLNALGLIQAPGQISSDGNPITGLTFVGMHNSGVPIISALNVPTNVGTNSEDVVISGDTNEWHLWEDGDGLPRQLSFEQTLGNQLTTTLVVYSYMAFTAGRYPAATAKVGGLDSTATFGLVAPSF